MKKDGKISSLADMQEAIRQANEMRQQRYAPSTNQNIT
jgi:hypothetical protein